MQAIQRVFLIDDDSIVNMINERIIKISNFTASVTCYLEARKALIDLNKIIDTEPDNFPDVIFLDINMPEVDGWEFLEEYSKFPSSVLSRCNVYMLTSSIDSNDIERAKTYDAVCDFISKPLSESWLEVIASRINKIF